MISAVKPSAMLFSVKSFLAAMLALYVALSIGLQNPSWAVITAYVVAQPRLGAVVSKGVYRVAGTIIGAAMAVFLVPPLGNSPELLSAVIALWLGFCVFLAATDRTARSYLFVLSGFSTCIIVFPGFSHPEAIFTTAVLRVQEITLGIVCSAIVHATLMPSSSTELLLGRLDRALSDAARWSADALAQNRSETLDRDRRQLAIAVDEIHELLRHAGYEGVGHGRQRRLYAALLAQIERLLPLSAGVDDRILELWRIGAMTPDVADLLDEVRVWVEGASSSAEDQGSEAERLRQRCAELEPIAEPGMTWRNALVLNLLARLSDLITVHGNCRMLRGALTSGLPNEEERRRICVLIKTGSRAIERDCVGALIAAASTTVALFIASNLWIASGWEGGASAVMMAGVFFAIYSGLGNPALALKNKFIGVVVRLLLGSLYVLVILPSIDSFPWLVAALAPTLLISGALLTTPRHSALAFNLIIGVLNPTIISERFVPDFASYLNNGLATLTGIYFALVMMKMTQSLWLGGASRRLLRAGRIDIARGTNKAMTQWRSRMGHRIALLATRAGNPAGIDARPTAEAWCDLRAGLSLAELAGLKSRLPAEAEREVDSILGEAAQHYCHLSTAQEASAPAALLAHIDRAIQAGTHGLDATVQRAVTLALVSVRRNIFPLAAPMQSIAA